MTPETIPDLNAFAVAAKAALDGSRPTASEPALEGTAAATEHEIDLAPVLDLPSAAELDRWLASPSRRAA